MLLLTLRGTPTLYYGDEIGMRDVPIPPERVQDPFEKNVPGHRPRPRSRAHADAVERRAATPASPTGEPWLPVADDFAAVNVAAQRDDPTSMLSALPRADRAAAHRAGARGRRLRADRVPESPCSPIARARGDRRFLIALNLAAEPARLPLPPEHGGYEVVLSTNLDAGGRRAGGVLELRGDEGRDPARYLTTRSGPSATLK